MMDYIQQWLDKSQQTMSRTTAVTPLGWITGSFLSALVIGGIARADQWVLIFLASGAAVSGLSFIGLNILFAKKDPDLLRSERHNILRLAIETQQQKGQPALPVNPLDAGQDPLAPPGRIIPALANQPDPEPPGVLRQQPKLLGPTDVPPTDKPKEPEGGENG